MTLSTDALKQVQKQAESELQEELFKEAVAKEKERLRRRRNRWVKIFPWRLRVERRELPEPTPKERIDHHVQALRKLGVRVTESYGSYAVERTGYK